MHWADVAAARLLERGKHHVISSGITPSGPIHVGSMREILTADAVARAVRNAGGEAELVYVADTADPLRKVYPFLNDSYAEWIGYPLAEIPAPEGGGSYADYFLKPFFEALRAVGVAPRVVDNHAAYREGRFADCTRAAVENAARAREILERVSGRQLPRDWFPWTCRDSDGRLVNGRVTKCKWPTLEFENEAGETVVNDLSAGEGKLPWRLDWPAKWSWLGVTFEAFGKDHATRGGSFDTGREIIEAIYGGSAPDHLVYEWIHLKGAGAMHSSTGVAVSAAEMLRIAPPEALRWLVLKPQPQRHIDFDPGLGVLNLVDDYDRAGQARFAGDTSDDRNDYTRAWELSQVAEIPEALPAVPYRHLVTLAQSRPGLDGVVETLQQTGELGDVSAADRDWLARRLRCLENWLAGPAPDAVRFTLQERPPQLELDRGERDALATLAGLLAEAEWQPQPLHDLFYTAQEANGLPAKALFKLVYRTLLGQSRGPRLGFFLATLDRKWVVARLRSYS